MSAPPWEAIGVSLQSNVLVSEPACEISTEQLCALGRWHRLLAARRRQGAMLEADLAPPPQKADEAERSNLRSYARLIVADDQPVVRAITCEVLEGLGYQVLQMDAFTCDFGLPCRVDGVILDVPVTSEASLAAIHQLCDWAPWVIVLTVLPEGLARAKMRDAGALAVVGTPVNPVELARIVCAGLQCAKPPRER
jgi:CheY-like chemotaxis protein